MLFSLNNNNNNNNKKKNKNKNNNNFKKREKKVANAIHTEFVTTFVKYSCIL